MVICRNCRSYFPDGTKLCNKCGDQIDELPTIPFLGRNISPDALDSTVAPESGSEERTIRLVGTVPYRDTTKPSLNPTHGDHQQSLPVHGNHQQSLPVHGNHQQSLPMHGNHQQSLPMHGNHQQPLPVHGNHYQPLRQPAKPLKKGWNGYQLYSLKTLLTLLAIVAVVTVTSLFVYFNNFAPSANTTAHSITPTTGTTNSKATLVPAGKAIAGQSLQVAGNHFTPNQTVFVTLDGKALDNNGAVGYTPRTSALSLPLAGLFSTNTNGTPVTVQPNGTFTVVIQIPTSWAGSTHYLKVNNQQGQELKSLALSIENHQVIPTATSTSNTSDIASTSPTSPTPTTTSTSPTSPTPTTTSTSPTPTPTPTPTPIPTPTPTPTISTPVVNTPPPPVVRTLTLQKTLSQSFTATGQGTTGGTPATGTIIIVNYGPAIHLPAGTTLDNTNGCTAPNLKMVLYNDIDLPTYSEGNYPTATVFITFTQPGTAGNIHDCGEQQAFYYMSPNESVIAYDINGGFSGGTDPQPYIYVQQSDIDTGANSLEANIKQSAVSDFQTQLQPNEHLVGDPQCSYQVISDHVAGDKVPNVTVTVQATCTAKAST
jgi:hypothetical protein